MSSVAFSAAPPKREDDPGEIKFADPPPLKLWRAGKERRHLTLDPSPGRGGEGEVNALRQGRAKHGLPSTTLHHSPGPTATYRDLPQPTVTYRTVSKCEA